VINGSDLRDFYVEQWRNIPEVVAAMGGDPGRIRGSNALAPIATSLARAVNAMGYPAILVAYQGYTKGNLKLFEFTLHHIAAYIRAATTDDDDHIEFGLLLTEAIPETQTQAVRYLKPHPDADPMDMPKFERVGAAKLDVDIWKLSFAVPEHAG
jgi:hypothetical protein